MKVFNVILSVILFHSASFAGNVHVECNLTDKDINEKQRAEQQVEDLFRVPVAEEINDESLDSEP